MQNEKTLCKQMNEHRGEMACVGGGHPGSILVVSKFCISTGTYFLSKPRCYFQDYVHWIEFLLQRKTSFIKYFLS